MKKFLFITTPQDAPYLPSLKQVTSKFQECSFSHVAPKVDTFTEIAMAVRKHKFSGIFTTSPALLQKLVGIHISEAKASIDNYAGSYFEKDGIPAVILNPLAQLITVPYGPFLAERYMSKLAAPEQWRLSPEFKWDVGNASNMESIYTRYAQPDVVMIAVDIETAKEPYIHITSISYTAIFRDFTSHTVVFPTDSEWSIAWVRRFNLLPAPKVFQNGKYDNNYLMRYQAPVYNWLWDTANLFHSWYSELPKDLGSLQAFCVHKAAYWKDLAKSSDQQDQLRYNALDTWATAASCITLLNQMPRWAKDNYLNEFPLNFPCVMCELTGIPRDMEVLKVEAKVQKAIVDTEGAELDTLLGVKGFNTASPKQKKALLTVLGCKDIADQGTDEKLLTKAAYRHPLIARIVSQITRIQKARKLLSTYLTEGKEFNGQILYSLNPHGTDTSRLASKEHHFWCGLQIQNIPRGASPVKRTLRAPVGWRIAECDYEQAESRDTAYAAGEPRLISAVSGDKDFHSLNAASFFGVNYSDIYDEVAGKVRDKERRELGKKVNHGANYLMGAKVLVATMGDKNIFMAASLLGLPAFWTSVQIAEFLLKQFHSTYPGLSGTYYPAVVAEIISTKMLTSRANILVSQAGHEPIDAYWNLELQDALPGLTRYCFSNPQKDKRAKNGYVAHVSQSLNAMTLNKAFMLVFYGVAINPRYRDNFRLLAQVHDSILFLFREGHEYIADKVKELMEIPIRIKSYDGEVREFTVPAAIKAGEEGKGALNWADI